MYTMEYYPAIKRNTFESVLMRWMNLEPIIQSEVSQKEKDKYHIIMHIYRIQKNGTEVFIYRTTVEKQTQRIALWAYGERGGNGERYGKSHMETYITIRKIDSQQELLYGSGNSNRDSVSTQRDGMGREIGGRFKRQGYLYTYGSFMFRFDRKQQNSIKQLSFN